MAGLTDEQWKIFDKVEGVLSRVDEVVMLAGGAVRDHLLGISPEDLDFATTSVPEKTARAFQSKGYHVIPTGIKHGTITVVIDKVPVEITTLRIDEKTDGRHAEVSWTRDFQLDAARRDLTINAMFMDHDRFIHDFFGGREDLQHRMIRFVGNDEARIREDYLRILRYFRFLSRYEGAQADPSTMHVIARWAHGLKQISGERIWAELSKIFVGPNRLIAAEFMHNNYVFDNISQHLKYDNNAKHKMRMLNGNPRARSPLYFIASMIRSGEGLNLIRGRLKFDNNSFDILNTIIGVSSIGSTLTVDSVRESVAKGARADLLYHRAVYDWNTPVCEFLDDFRRNPMPKFPVSGTDIKALGYEGRRIGEALDLLKEAWAQSKYKATKEKLLELIT